MSWKFATVDPADRAAFTGSYSAYDKNEIDITPNAPVWFKTSSTEPKYADDFGGSLDQYSLENFIAAPDGDNLRVNETSGVYRISLEIGTQWKDYYPV